MFGKFSLVGLVAAAALLVAVPAAWGKGQAPEPQWQQALMIRSEAFNQEHRLGEYRSLAAQDRYREALALRSEALNRQHGIAVGGSRVGSYPSPYVRDASQGGSSPAVATPPDAFERAVQAAQTSVVSRYPDAFERAVGNRVRDAQPTGHVDRYEIDLPAGPVGTPSTTSGREVEWPQIGAGFGIGILLALGLVLAMRLTRGRPLAHG